MRRTFCLMMVLLFTSCRQSEESKLVGTWTIPIGDAKTTYLIYKPDHTYVMRTEGYGEPIIATSSWHIEGHEIVVGSKEPKMRDRIVKLGKHELQIFDASQNRVFTYRRVK